MAKTSDTERYEKGKTIVLACLKEKLEGTTDPIEARKCAERALDTLKSQKDAELDEANKRFKRLQIIEFILGALAILQMVLFLLLGEPYVWPLAGAATACVVLYVIAAILDSKAKNKREDLFFETLAVKKTRFKNASNGIGISIEFKGLGIE